MGRQGKVAVIVLAIISTIGVIAAVGAYAAKMQEEKRRMAVERDLKATQAAKETVEAELKDTQSAKARLEDQVASLKWEAQSLTTQLEDETKAKEELTLAIADKQAALDQVAQALEQERGDRAALDAQLTKTQDDLAGLRKELEQIKEAKAVLEERLAKVNEKSVDLQRVVVNKGAAQPSSQGTVGASFGEGTAGQVLVVNREFDFVVVNLGKNQGMQVGKLFEVYRDNEILGQVKVEKVYDALSACAIQPDTKKDQLREGDKVRAL